MATTRGLCCSYVVLSIGFSCNKNAFCFATIWSAVLLMLLTLWLYPKNVGSIRIQNHHFIFLVVDCTPHPPFFNSSFSILYLLSTNVTTWCYHIMLTINYVYLILMRWMRGNNFTYRFPFKIERVPLVFTHKVLACVMKE